MSRLSFSAMACIVIAAILGLAAFSNVLAQQAVGFGTSSSVICGDVGSSPMSFSAMITWAELDTGNSSAVP